MSEIPGLSGHALPVLLPPVCVESRCDAVALGSNISVSAPFVRRYRIRLSGKTSRLHPRHVVSKPAQTYEPKVPVKMREWIAPALSTPGFVLELQPPAQPHRCIAVECPIRLADGAYLEVVRPSAQRAVHLTHQPCGFLPGPRSVRQGMDFLNHALDALLRWPVPQARLAGSRRIHSSERVAQKIELSFRDLADSCLLLVNRELQLAHDLAQLLQGFFGFASSAQDHEIVGVGHDARAEALLQPEHLPSQHEPAYVEIRQQWGDG